MTSLTYQSCLLFTVVFFTTCSNFPKDAENSFDDAKTHGLKIGIVENPPFIIRQNGKFSGIEIHLIESFARRNNLDIQYTAGTESQLIEKLEAFQLHLLAGGFEKNTNWMSKAGLSASYDGSHIFLVPKGENQLLYRLEKHIYGMQ